MHLQALRYLLAVVEEGHFGRAAARMHVSQPSVSQAITRLERQFGTRLLSRSGARVVPTEAGLRVVEEVRAAVRHLDRALGAAKGFADTVALRVGCTPFLSIWVTVQWLRPFRLAHPDVELSVAELDVPAQARALLAGEIDLAVGEPLAPDPGLCQRTLREDPCAIWMSTDHALACRDEVWLSELDGIRVADGDPLVYPYYHAWVRATLKAAGVTPIYAEATLDTPTGISRIIDGTQVSLSADMLAEGTIPGIAVRRVADAVRWRWTVTLSRDPPTPSAIAFTTWQCAQGEVSRH